MGYWKSYVLITKENLADKIALLFSSFPLPSEGLLSYGETDTKFVVREPGVLPIGQCTTLYKLPLGTAEDFGLCPGPEALGQLGSTCHCLGSDEYRLPLHSCTNTMQTEFPVWYETQMWPAGKAGPSCRIMNNPMYGSGYLFSDGFPGVFFVYSSNRGVHLTSRPPVTFDRTPRARRRVGLHWMNTSNKYG